MGCQEGPGELHWVHRSDFTKRVGFRLHGRISLGREEGGPVFEHVGEAPTVLSLDTMLLLYAHGGPWLPPSYHWGGPRGDQLAQGCTTGSEWGTEASPFPLGGSRLEDLLGVVSSWRGRVGERRLLDMRLRWLLLLVAVSCALNVTGSISWFAGECGFHGVHAPAVARLSYVCDGTQRQVLMSQSV